MKIRAILPIQNFQPEIEGSLPNVFGFEIKKGEYLRNIPPIELDNIKQSIGQLNYEKFEKGYILHYFGEISENPLISIDDNSDVSSKKMLDTMAIFFRCFWYIKDNSTFVREIYISYPEVNHVSGRMKSEVSFNSKGCISTTTYNVMEFAQILHTYPLIKTLTTTTLQRDRYLAFDINQPHPNPLNLIPYKNSRAVRAITFMVNARNNTVLIMKIASYIGILECLFTNSRYGVIETLKKRIPKYLGIAGIERDILLQLIETGYDVRSRYLHGDNYEDSVTLDKISEKIDNLCREILNKVLTSADNNVFTDIYEDSGNEELKNYFANL